QQAERTDLVRSDANVHPADHLAFPPHVHRHRDDQRHRDDEDLHQRPQEDHRVGRHAHHAVTALMESSAPCGGSDAVAAWPASIHAQPFGTAASTTTGRIAPLTSAFAPVITPSARAASALTRKAGARLSGCACKALARRTTASVR